MRTQQYLGEDSIGLLTSLAISQERNSLPQRVYEYIYHHVNEDRFSILSCAKKAGISAALDANYRLMFPAITSEHVAAEWEHWGRATSCIPLKRLKSFLVKLGKSGRPFRRGTYLPLT